MIDYFYWAKACYVLCILNPELKLGTIINLDKARGNYYLPLASASGLWKLL